MAPAEIIDRIKASNADLESWGMAANPIECVAVAQRVLGETLPRSASESLELVVELTHLLEVSIHVGHPAARHIKAVMLGLITLAQVDLFRRK